MSEAYAGRRACGAIRHERGNAAALGAADWLWLAAAPTFAIMALLTGVLGGGPTDMLCSAAQDASPLSGMGPMYLLMSAFHAAPWLKLVSSRRSGARRPGSGVRQIERCRTLLAREHSQGMTSSAVLPSSQRRPAGLRKDRQAKPDMRDSLSCLLVPTAVDCVQPREHFVRQLELGCPQVLVQVIERGGARDQ
jgi:hypothetical protein